MCIYLIFLINIILNIMIYFDYIPCYTMMVSDIKIVTLRHGPEMFAKIFTIK